MSFKPTVAEERYFKVLKRWNHDYCPTMKENIPFIMIDVWKGAIDYCLRPSDEMIVDSLTGEEISSITLGNFYLDIIENFLLEWELNLPNDDAISNVLTIPLPKIPLHNKGI